MLAVLVFALLGSARLGAHLLLLFERYLLIVFSSIFISFISIA